MTKILLTLSLMFALSCGFAQQRKCGSYEKLQEQLIKDPMMAQRRQLIEAKTAGFIAQGGVIRKPDQRGVAVYNIPVVVHVVYNTSAQNISDAQIQSQINALNKDYQLLNADTAKVPSVFKPVTADCQIQFCLAQQDPNGNASNGIVRKQTTRTSFSTDDAVKNSSTGGDNAWNTAQYLNLWVCNLSGGVLGYAQFPGGPAGTDGVVITYTGFGTTGTAAAPFNLGRTATHEVGHWLNLYHIWGDDGTACTGSDQVGDTPNQADENYGCPSFPQVSCSNGPNGDMFMNYMDYTDDACMYMFTAGQKNRMYAVLGPGGFRASLTSSLGCTPPSTTGCNPPSGITAASVTQTSATISWSASSGATSYNLQYKTAAVSAYTTVSNITSTSYTLTALTVGTTYNYQVSTNCSSSVSNYSTAQSFTTQNASTGCTDNYEPNNTYSAGVIIPVNTTITGKISSSGDKDYYKFTNTSTARNIKITLTTLPADYDIVLYSPSGLAVKTSQNGSTSAESITYNTNTVGTYTIYVYGYNGANNANSCYTLNLVTSSSTLRQEEEERSVKDVIKLFPSPASAKVNIMLSSIENSTAEISVSNQAGALVMKKQLSIAEGFNNNAIDVSRLRNGLYFIKIQQGKSVSVHKLYVQH